MKRLKVPICKALAVLMALLVMLSSPVLPVSAEAIATPSDAVDMPIDADSELLPAEVPMHPLQAAVDALGYAHVAAQGIITVYSTAALREEAFTIHSGVLLVTAFIQQGDRNVLEVQFLTADGKAILAYADAADLPDAPMTKAEVFATIQSTAYALVPTLWDSALAFQVDAEAVQVSTVNSTVEMPDESDAPVPSAVVEISETPSAEVIANLNITIFHPGDFALVTTSTRVFLEPDETAYTGYFVSEAVVQVESARQDGWCRVRYLYGDDHADGTLKWTKTGAVYVLSSDLLPTDAQDCTVTDYADPYAVSALAADGFSLRSISMDLGSFAVGQTGLHGSSGKDSAYKQIATLPGRGKIYATPHYLEGYTVYCLEHLLPGPGENISGGGQQPTGPYMVVDLASYMSTPGYSGVMYKESTMHAIGWVLRHTVPFMELDRSDSNNRTWSRVAGQFAIREVIKQLEGADYVRDYWNMEDFYAASDNAPAVYLAYARWLAQGGIARAGVTGSITASNQQTSSANGMNLGTVTLTTDADLMRISKAYGALTGHTAGEDASYYYLHSGNTVTLSSSATTFGMTVESISSPDEEASFLVSVPDAAIQKVLIPQPGQPYPLKSLSLSFEAAKGEIRVIKNDAEDGTTLAGATFELVSNGTTIATATTGADGVVTFSDIPAGTYTLRETSAPEGYVLSVPAEQTVTVASGQTSEAAFTNRRCTAKIRIVKTDAQTGQALTGAEFTIADAVGEIVATLTTDEHGVAESDWLRYGVYTVTETKAPEHYISSGFSTVVEAFEDGRTYAFTVENEPAKGYIRLPKTDSLDGTPLNGVRFDIYDASGEVVVSMTTDERGAAVSPALTPGCYTVCEADAPEGYVWEVIQLTTDVLSYETIDLTVTNKPIQGKIRIEKRDTLTGERLAGAEFTVTDAEGEIVAILTTDANGVAETDWLRYGVYTVTETKAPEHYVDSGLSCEVTINEADMGTYLVDCDNVPIQGCILLDKKGLQLTDIQLTTDAWGNEVHTPVYEEGYLAGAVFEVCAAEEIVGSDGTVWYRAGEVADIITTTASGGDASRMLPLGKYEVVEASAPAGYVCANAPIPVELQAVDESTPVVEVRITAQNDYLSAEITLFKEKEVIQTAVSGKDVIHSVLTTAPGEGFVFGLFTAQDHPYAGGTLVADTLVATGATDENGMLTFSGRYPHGEYYIRELYAPDGWKIIAEQLPITLSPEQSENNVIRVLLTEPIRNERIRTEVTLTKTDITGEKMLPGAVIEVYNEAGECIYRDTTDEHGEIARIPVTPGQYTFREVCAPSGYALNEAVMHFTVSEDGTITGDTAIRDDFTRFSIQKTDESGHPLSGVVFCLVNADNIAVQSATTDRNGLATFEHVPFGSYRVVETVAPAGYEPAEFQVEVTVDGTFVNLDKPFATIVNVPNEVLVQKVDGDGKPLSGATFGLFDALGEQFAVATSDESGLVRFTKVSCGSYTLRELTAPDGYLVSKEEIAFTIDADYRSTGQPVATVTNQRKQVQFIKVDTSENALPGVAFSLINAVTHEVMETAISNDRGEFVFTRFDYGNWIIRETAAPEGYSRMEDYLLHVDESWTEPEPIRLINIPSTYLFYKCDNRKNPLSGATFAGEDESGNTVQEVTSAENGVVMIEGLIPGKYTIRETDTVEGFAVSGDTITVVIDENYTVPTKLKRFVNYPSIATGIDVSPTMLTWVGMGLMAVAVLALILWRRRK